MAATTHLAVYPQRNIDAVSYSGARKAHAPGCRLMNYLAQGTWHGELSPDGKHAVDSAVASFGNVIFTHPIVIEGYSDAATSTDALSWFYARADSFEITSRHGTHLPQRMLALCP